MTLKKGSQTYIFNEPLSITNYSCCAGKKEGEGPLGKGFDFISDDSYFGSESWEKGESEMIRKTISILLKKSQLSPSDIDLLFAGDLNNQITASTFGTMDFMIPGFGIYSACATFCEALILSCFSLNNSLRRCIALASSHFCTAERQFRYPLEYGGVRPPSSQWTVTSSSAVLIEKKKQPPFIRAVTPGKIIDLGIKDSSNMGAAMAPAACDTIISFFKDTNLTPSDFDLIATGDLGVVGSSLLNELLKHEGYNLEDKLTDCGKLIYDLKRQNVPSGASGAGCIGAVLCSAFLEPLKEGNLKNILLIATGALLSPSSCLRKESIPGIAHLVWISFNEEGF